MLNWRVPLFYLLPPVLAVAVYFGVNFKTDLSAFIIAGESAEEILLASEMQSGALSRRYLISIASKNKASVAKTFIDKLQADLQTIEGVREVWLPGQQGDLTLVIKSLYGQYANSFYSLQAEPYLSQLFSKQGMADRAKFLKTALLSPQAAWVKPIALRDPLLLTLNGFQSLSKQKQQGVSNDRQYRNLILETQMTGMDAAQQSRIQVKIKRLFKALNQISQQQYQLEMTGVPVFATATQTLIKGDITRISIISTIALLVLFLWIFRYYYVLFQVFSLLAIVMLSAMLNTQLIFGSVHGMTVALGSTLVGICIDYPIHALVHAQSVKAGDKIKVIRKIWPSLLLGGITTMIGYFALGASGYPGFQQVAVFAASGISVSLILTRFILPGLLTARFQQQINIPLVAVWSAFCGRFRLSLIALLLVICLVSLLQLKSLNWMEDMQELTPELNHLKQKDKKIRARMTSIEPGRFILLTGRDIESTLQKAEEIYPLLDELKKTGGLSEYYGLYPWLLSAQKQQNNQNLLQQYLTPENLLRWQQALKQQGISVSKLGHFNYQQMGELTLDQVLATPIKRLIDSRVIVANKQAILLIWLADHQPEKLKAELGKIDGAQYFSQRELLNQMTRDYTERTQLLLLLGLAIILTVLMVRYKSVLKTVQTLMPAILAAIFIIVGWSITGAAISFLHLVGFLLVVAICVDYGIFYQENRGGDINLTYQAMAASMLTSTLAFGSLMAAESTALRILAGVVALGVILGFLLCPIIIKDSYIRVK